MAPLSGSFVRDHAIALVNEGADVTVLLPNGPGLPVGYPGLKFHSLSHFGLFGPPGAMQRLHDNPARIVGLLPFKRQLEGFLRELPHSRVVAHWLVPTAWVVAQIRPTSPLEAIAHGGDVELLERLPRFAVQKIVKDLYKTRQLALRVVSEQLARRLLELAPRLQDVVYVEPMPLSQLLRQQDRALKARAAALRQLFWQGSPLCVVVSRFTRQKKVARALIHVQKRNGMLVLVGDGPERVNLIRAAQNLGIRCVSTGAIPHEEALAWMIAADLVIVPLADHEGNPTTRREAEYLARQFLVLDSDTSISSA